MVEYSFIFKGFVKTVSYLVLGFSKLGTAFFKKYLPASGYTTSLQCHKTPIKKSKILNKILNISKSCCLLCNISTFDVFFKKTCSNLAPDCEISDNNGKN